MRIFYIANAIISMLAAPAKKRIPVGGQAVIEGVLMKGPEHWGSQSENHQAIYGSKRGLVRNGSSTVYGSCPLCVALRQWWK